MKLSDRAIGYISLIALFCTFAGVAYGMYSAHQDVPHTATVDFDELGTLQPEDDVVVRGYRVGTIGTVTWLGDRSRVQIKFDEPLIIREGTQFNNVNYALMGQRRLEIIPSKTGKVLPEDFIHTGHFEPGIAEALRLMEDVGQQISYVRDAVLLIANGDSTHASAQQKYEEIIGTVEGLLNNIDKTVNSLQPKVRTFFNQIQDASNTLIETTNQADTAIENATQSISEKITQAQDIIKTLADGTTKINETVTAIENSPAIDKLLNSKEPVEKLNEIVTKLNKLIAAIDTKGIKIYDDNGNPVKLVTWKNMNLIGDKARDKAKERAEKGESLPESKAPEKAEQ
ncbi:MlaD family protein [Fibrobacter sp. UBA4309]|uniref:MlaD family protein n=1 Tax=Fibrobacter sp. UBA4309 TaxID=1946537 RepID=UPI0025C20C3E|nr:MlaD family protein [Fibrobacter sp. UBA4309]